MVIFTCKTFSTYRTCILRVVSIHVCDTIFACDQQIQSILRPTIYWKTGIIFIADVLHQFAQNTSFINHRVRHVTIYELHGVFIVSQASFFSGFQLFITWSALTVSIPRWCPVFSLWYGLWKSLQLHSGMSITDLCKIQSSSQTVVCEESVAGLTYCVKSTFSQSFLSWFANQVGLEV